MNEPIFFSGRWPTEAGKMMRTEERNKRNKLEYQKRKLLTFVKWYFLFFFCNLPSNILIQETVFLELFLYLGTHIEFSITVHIYKLPLQASLLGNEASVQTPYTFFFLFLAVKHSLNLSYARRKCSMLAEM